VLEMKKRENGFKKLSDRGEIDKNETGEDRLC
jgi:hypothetical protein